MFNSFYDEDELQEMGFGYVGHDVQISRTASLYNRKNIEIEDHARIDDFCVLSAKEGGKIIIGPYVHISTHCLVISSQGVVFRNFSGISSGCRLFGSSDDYSGFYLTNPCVPEKYRNCHHGYIELGYHAVVGAGSILMPGVMLGDASAVGAMSLVTKSIPSGEIHAGVPARFIKTRSLKLIELESQFMKSLNPEED